VAVVATENYPVPPVLGGAVATYISELAPRLDGGREVTVVSVRHPGLARDERVGRVRHRRVGPPPPVKSLIRLVPRRRRWRGDAEKRVYLESVARVLRGFDGTIIVGNRPQSVRRLRRAAPSARIVLRLDNLHLRDPEALAACDALMPCSSFVGEAAAAAAAGPVPVRVVHNGVDLDAFRPRDEAGRAEARRLLGLPDGPVVLFVGRLVRDKGPHLLLEAAPALLRGRPDVSFVLVGSAHFGRGTVTDYERELRARAEAIGPQVRLTGFVPPAELPAWFAAADVFCAPGLWDEPFGMVYAESMASGVPPVGTARGGIPEVVDDGKTGLLLPRSPTAADVEERLGALLEDPALRERLARAGRAAAEARFSWDAMARATEALLR
jgi:spore coat protein SA